MNANAEKKRLQWNYIFHLSYQILTIILPIITAPYISRVLKPEGVGQYNYATTCGLVYIMVAALGTGVYGVREISYIREDREALSRLFWEIMLIRLLGTLMIIPVYAVQVWLQPEYRLIMTVVGVQVFSAVFDISWFFQGLEDFKKTVARSMAVRIISVILIFLVVKRPEHVIRYTWINSLGVAAGNLALWFYLPGILKKAAFRELQFWKHFLPSCMLLIPTLSSCIYTFCNKIILGLMTDDAQVGYFSQPYSIITLLMTVITALSTVLVPNIAHLIAENRMEEVGMLVRKSLRYVMFLGAPMMIGLICVSHVFVLWFFGADYESSIPIMRMMALLPVVVGTASITGVAVLVPLKKQNLYTASILAASVLSLLLDVLLIPVYRANGATVALVAAETTVTVIQMYFVLRILKISLRELWRDVRNYWLAAATMVPFICWIPGKAGGGIKSLAFMAICGAAVYAAVLLLLRDEYIRYILKLMQTIFAGKRTNMTQNEDTISANMEITGNNRSVWNRLMTALVFLFIVIACDIQKLLDPVLHVEVNEKIWLLGIELLLLLFTVGNRSLLRHWRKIKWILVISAADCIMLLCGVYQSTFVNGMPIRTTIFYSVPYFYAVMAVPISLLLINGDLELKQFLKWIVWCSMISYGIRILISWYFGKTGTVIFRSVTLGDEPEKWIRKGVLRLNPPVFASMMLPITAYLFMEEKAAWKKALCVIAAIVPLYFTFKIHQSRAVMVYQGMTLVVLWFSRKKVTWKDWAVLAVLAALVFRTEKFQEFLFSFSLKNTDEFATTGVRINAMKYFATESLKSGVLGLGYLDGAAATAPGWGHITDIGLLQTVYTLGLPGLIYMLLNLANNMNCIFDKIRMKAKNNLMMLQIAAIVSFWMFNLSMDGVGGYLACSIIVILLNNCYGTK